MNLEGELQTELNVAAASRTDERIAGGHVGCGAPAAKRAGGCRSHRELAGPALGRPARASLCRIARGKGRNRTKAGRLRVAAVSRPLPAAAPLSRSATIGNSFRPTAYRSRRCKT